MPCVVRSGRLVWFVAVLPCLCLAGCGGDDGIKTYRVATQKGPGDDAQVPPPPAGPPKVRFLGAVVPGSGGSSYYVRFGGMLEIEKINPLEKDFDAFVNSIRVPGEGGKPISWTIPAGWKEIATAPVAGGGFVITRTVTIQKADGSSPQLYISELTPGTQLSNVNRWRTDFAGIPAVPDLKSATTEIQLGSTKAYRVDFRGPGGKSLKGGGPFMGGGG